MNQIEFMKKMKADVTEFRTAFGLEILRNRGMNVEEHILHHSLIIEELSELLAKADLDIERLDAIVDSVYVLMGQQVHDYSLIGVHYFMLTLYDLAISLGYDFEGAWQEVHDSNMSKLCVSMVEAQRTKHVYEVNKGYEEVEIIAQENYFIVRNAVDVTLPCGKFVKAGKTLKSINYKPADLTAFVGG